VFYQSLSALAAWLPELRQGRRRQRAKWWQGSAIDLHEVAPPEILDPRRVNSTPRFPVVLEKPAQVSAAPVCRYVAAEGNLR
jgi:hypothetical protein